MRHITAAGLAALCIAAPLPALAQTPANLSALRGLLPVARLPATPEGRAALDANLKVTGDIQSGAANQPLLLPLPEQRLLALKDCFITDGNATQLADGLGTRLGGAYQAKARYADYKTFTSVSPAVATLIGYTNSVTNRFERRQVLLRQRQPARRQAGLARGGGAPVRRYGRRLRQGLRPPGGYARLGCVRQRPALPDPAAAHRLPGGGLFRQRLPQPRLAARPEAGSRRQPLLPERPHDLRLHRVDDPRDPAALPLPADGDPRRRVRQRPDRRRGALRDGRDRRPGDLAPRARPPARQRPRLCRADPHQPGRPRTRRRRHRQDGGPDRLSGGGEGGQGEIDAFVAETCGTDIAACAAQDSSRFKDAAANAAFYASTQTYGLPVVHGRAPESPSTSPPLPPRRAISSPRPSRTCRSPRRTASSRRRRGPAAASSTMARNSGLRPDQSLRGRRPGCRAGGRPAERDRADAVAPKKKGHSEGAARSLGRKRPRGQRESDAIALPHCTN